MMWRGMLSQPDRTRRLPNILLCPSIPCLPHPIHPGATTGHRDPHPAPRNQVLPFQNKPMVEGGCVFIPCGQVRGDWGLLHPTLPPQSPLTAPVNTRMYPQIGGGGSTLQPPPPMFYLLTSELNVNLVWGISSVCSYVELIFSRGGGPV